MLKLARAEEHLEYLTRAIRGWDYSGAHELVREGGIASGEYRWRIKILHSPPVCWSPVIGEFLYNVHSALDHLAWELACRHSAPSEPAGTVTYPIFKNKTRFWRKNKTGDYHRQSGAHRLERVPDDAREYIEETQPYTQGDASPWHPLWLLHELSNEDKHKTLHVVVSALASNRLSIDGLVGVEVGPAAVARGPLGDGAVVLRIAVRVVDGFVGEAQLQLHPEFALDVAFSEQGPAPGAPVLQTLWAIWTYVLRDVMEDRFTPYFGAESIPADWLAAGSS